jgi:Beta-lactamase
MVTKISKLPLANQPGEVWEYSAAVDVLGRIIEVVSKMDLDRFIEERVTKPLGMSSTGFYVREADRDRLAQPQIDPATGKRPPLFDATQKPKLFSGGGGGVSTASDYLLFCEMLLHGGKFGTTRLLSQSTINLMTSSALKSGITYSAATLQRFGDLGPTPAMGQGFGLGFAVRTETGQNPLPGSTGSFYWTGAYGTTFFVDPKQQLIIIMMIQVPLPAIGTRFVIWRIRHFHHSTSVFATHAKASRWLIHAGYGLLVPKLTALRLAFENADQAQRSHLGQPRHFGRGRPLPVYPDQQTFSVFVGMSQPCPCGSCDAPALALRGIATAWVFPERVHGRGRFGTPRSNAITTGGRRFAGWKSASTKASNGRRSSAGTLGPFRSAVTHHAWPSRSYPAAPHQRYS